MLGVVLIGAGTSLPELALSLRAAVEKRASMSVGNVIGSNVLNIALIGFFAFKLKMVIGASQLHLKLLHLKLKIVYINPLTFKLIGVVLLKILQHLLQLLVFAN